MSHISLENFLLDMFSNVHFHLVSDRTPYLLSNIVDLLTLHFLVSYFCNMISDLRSSVVTPPPHKGVVDNLKRARLGPKTRLSPSGSPEAPSLIFFAG